MSKETITIDGQTYIKQGSQADTSPSKEEVDACKELCAQSRKNSTILGISLGIALGFLTSSFGFGVFIFFAVKLLFSIVMTSAHKNKFPEEVWDAVTPKKTYDILDGTHPFSPFYNKHN
ncbi:MAG TPA: hypothetical protein QGF58_10705 [Myxococcota bacterium]|nr:hypothetical protein [Myxococcota bacterium]